MTLTREQILAMPAGPEMDGRVARLIMNDVPGQVWDREYSTDISAAWEVVEKLNLTVGPSTSDRPGPRYEAGDLEGFEYEGWGYVNSAEGETAPLAICRAALLTTL